MLLGYLLAYLFVLLASWLLLIVLHEGGHAGAGLLLLPGPVTVFLGSYGHLAGNWQLRIGRLHLHIKRNMLRWQGGCCFYTPVAMARWRHVVLVVAGPLVPLLVASLAFYFSFRGANGLHRLLTLTFLIIAFGSTLQNIFSSTSTVRLASGERVGTDGRQLRQLLFLAARAQQEQRAYAALLAGRYAEGLVLYTKLLKQGPPTRALLNNAIHALFQIERYSEALVLSNQCQQEFAAEITDNDRFGHALLLSRTEQHHLAMEAYSALLNQPQPYLLAYSNRGYTHNLLGSYELALADFNQVIRHEAAPAYGYANRGLALLKLGQEEAGLADIRHSLTLDPANAYSYRNLGIYHFSRNEYAEALAYFKRAQQHDPATHQLADYLQQTRQHLEEASGTGGPAQ
ncbi:MAG: tetratricopeptide repeat protein [Hymenobacter sp.]|nr:MAG: tetratricopeptide repeat protein [Hymenobacter sp.]